MTCDFCNIELTRPWWVYPAHAFETEIIIVSGSTTQYLKAEYSNAWNACIACHHFLIANDLDGLALSAAQSALLRKPVEERTPENENFYKGITRQVIDAFIEHRLGSPTRIP